MPKKKEQKHVGQRPLLNPFDQSKDEKGEKIPKGMPPLAAIQSECVRRGLLPSDGEYLYNAWLANGYKTARGITIKNWRAAICQWKLGAYFPSQRKTSVKLRDAVRERDQATFERIKREQRNGNH